MKRIVETVVLCLLVLPLTAREVPAADSRPCAEDVAKLCKDVQPGGGRLAECLKDHENELSVACKSRQEEIKIKIREAVQACHDDVAQFCSEVKPGGGRIAVCLKKHEKELSRECREKLVQRSRR